jgi:hypothetical protein
MAGWCKARGTPYPCLPRLSWNTVRRGAYRPNLSSCLRYSRAQKDPPLAIVGVWWDLTRKD